MNLTFQEVIQLSKIPISLPICISPSKQNWSTVNTSWLPLTDFGTKKSRTDFSPPWMSPGSTVWRHLQTMLVKVWAYSLFVDFVWLYYSFPSVKNYWFLAMGFKTYIHAHSCHWKRIQSSQCLAGRAHITKFSCVVTAEHPVAHHLCSAVVLKGLYTLAWTLPLQTAEVWWDESNTFVSQLLCLPKWCLLLPLPCLACCHWMLPELF